MARGRIVFLDEPTLIEESKLDELRLLGEVEVHWDRPDRQTIVDRLAQAEVAIVEWSHLPARTFSSAPYLRHIVLPTTGSSRIDITAARRAGVVVSNTPDYCARSVAEFTLGAIILLARDLPRAASLVASTPDTVDYLSLRPGVQLIGKTLGVIGLGGIGRAVADLGRAFGLEVIAYNRTARRLDIALLPLETVVESSDALVLCVPHNADTERLLSGRLLRRTKPNAIIVSIAGKGLLDEHTLLELVDSGHLLGAAIDGRAGERTRSQPRLLQTPDIAWYTVEAARRSLELVVETIRLGFGGDYRFVL